MSKTGKRVVAVVATVVALLVCAKVYAQSQRIGDIPFNKSFALDRAIYLEKMGEGTNGSVNSVITNFVPVIVGTLATTNTIPAIGTFGANSNNIIIGVSAYSNGVPVTLWYTISGTRTNFGNGMSQVNSNNLNPPIIGAFP